MDAQALRSPGPWRTEKSRYDRHQTPTHAGGVSRRLLEFNLAKSVRAADSQAGVSIFGDRRAIVSVRSCRSMHRSYGDGCAVLGSHEGVQALFLHTPPQQLSCHQFTSRDFAYLQCAPVRIEGRGNRNGGTFPSVRGTARAVAGVLGPISSIRTIGAPLGSDYPYRALGLFPQKRLFRRRDGTCPDWLVPPSTHAYVTGHGRQSCDDVAERIEQPPLNLRGCLQ